MSRLLSGTEPNLELLEVTQKSVNIYGSKPGTTPNTSLYLGLVSQVFTRMFSYIHLPSKKITHFIHLQRDYSYKTNFKAYKKYNTFNVVHPYLFKG